uniref:Uncharacterized protein LOC108950622 n=1 Tax=Phallusia mammillata TaxID=59560 RepID=A0A6F9DK17_9ASCI|nr:uncharacterized protein LOC108950622 [Phallusia mammillata]
MDFASCCDIYCTSCRIWYLKFLRPGDTVPFHKPKYILPLGVAQILIAFVVIVLDTLALYCQGQGFAAPAPSFLGSPGFPLWLSTLVGVICFTLCIHQLIGNIFLQFIVSGCVDICCSSFKSSDCTCIRCFNHCNHSFNHVTGCHDNGDCSRAYILSQASQFKWCRHCLRHLHSGACSTGCDVIISTSMLSVSDVTRRPMVYRQGYSI